MANTVRAKFKVTSTMPPGNICLQAVYSSDPGHENKAFWDATPGANLQMWINKEEARSFFELGREYCLDFSPAPDSKP